MAHTILIILGVSIFAFVITGFIVLMLMAFKKRDLSFQLEKMQIQEAFTQQLMQAQMEMQEQTYQQISQDIHDNVGQLLSTSRMLLFATAQSLGEANTPPNLHTANATVGQAIQELRSLAKLLDTRWLEQFDFHHNLLIAIERINSGEMIKATYHSEVDLDIPVEKQIMLFRIVQEAMQNAIRHASPANIDVTCRNLAEDRIEICITNDGSSFVPVNTNQGLGIANMQYRTKLLGGCINWQAGPNGQGTFVCLQVPL